MKLDQKQIHHLCEKVLNELKTQNLVVFKAQEDAVLKRMIQEFEKNLRDEDVLEAEAKKLLVQYQREANAEGLNQAKLFMMLKKELAKKKGFIL
jgi:uncharacterized protein